jgi:hypothetical protein
MLLNNNKEAKTLQKGHTIKIVLCVRLKIDETIKVTYRETAATNVVK